MFTFSLNGACDAVVFQDGEEKLHEVRGVWWSYDVEHLQGEKAHTHEQLRTTG